MNVTKTAPTPASSSLSPSAASAESPSRSNVAKTKSPDSFERSTGSRPAEAGADAGAKAPQRAADGAEMKKFRALVDGMLAPGRAIQGFLDGLAKSFRQ